MADDPYSRLRSVAERGRVLRAIAAYDQLAIEVETVVVEIEAETRARSETDPSHVGRVRWLLHHRSYAPALVATLTWVEVDPDNALARYLYGRSLLGLGRLIEARASFDRACTLRPSMLEAQLMRREVDRNLKLLRDQVGPRP